MGSGRSGLGRLSASDIGARENTDAYSKFTILAKSKMQSKTSSTSQRALKRDLADEFVKDTGINTDDFVVNSRMSVEDLGKTYDAILKANEFVQVDGLKVLTSSDASVLARCGANELQINVSYFRDVNALNDTLQMDGRVVPGPIETTFVHELAHQYVYETIQKIFTSPMDRTNAWFNLNTYTPQSKQSLAEVWNTPWITQQIEAAYKTIHSGNFNKSDMMREIGKISPYATKSYHETVAESFADVYTNGERAAPMAKAVVKHFRNLNK